MPFNLTSTTNSSLYGNNQSLTGTKPGCKSQCGNLTIPYPFGIGKECSLYDQFAVTCNTSYKPPRPFLNTTLIGSSYVEDRLDPNVSYEYLEYEILAISSTEVRIRNYLAVACYDTEGNTIVLKSVTHDLRSKSFTLSMMANMLTLVGCDYYGMYTVNNVYTGGCLSLCHSDGKNVFYAMDSYSGMYCCQTPTPGRFDTASRATNFWVELKAADYGGHLFNACSYSFLGERDKFDFRGAPDLKDPTLPERVQDTVPLVLEWTVASTNCSHARKNKSSYACQANSSDCTDSDQGSGYRCSCLPGYEGNPYLTPGCTVFSPSIGSAPIILSLIGFWLFLVLKKRKMIRRKAKHFERNGGLLLQQKIVSNQDVVNETKVFTAEELEKATDNFNEDRILGQGGQGTVYKGMLADGKIVAIKKSKKIDESQLEQFINELVILSQVNHRYIVKLLGCCLETEVPLLVYEFVPNGTLFQHIHNPSEDFHITWAMRLQIATDAAGALAYLHSDSSSPIYHRDIKTSNILLDEKFRAKVSDFGTSRSISIDQTHLTTQVYGTLGYLDPEYFQSNQFTEKSDVYSFGVVLVELLTGEKAIRSLATPEGRSLSTWFLSSIENSTLLDIIDPQVLKEGSVEGLVSVANLAKQCLHLDGKRRPTMREDAQ
ncbi:Wall-associated receptor kinase-like 9-like protein [Drosera capensis]